ncbi:tetrahydromethanopterin S-methyltransferase subunit C [Methanocella sp. CWC-04]|uniref:Tetrahydromethanopterin S-methyltransferase subunit C n=1 Tax=Methanooceanicella nereidis TaxID=2052831 RepID=A0AAP2RF52_9EURY|nr:tetrahydromethanopterin S-methyltransferase subunit C [Methanocella sp. CWC-04]MCD1296193.1 tetrahydromethanopterin S-methyltransferase subunit C [Methanocella sp. CWC-04]
MSEHKDMSWNTLAAIGMIGGLLAIYIAYFVNNAMDVAYGSFIGAIGAIFAIVWGADAVRQICKYGIGTGVPSIGMLAFGMGLLTTILGLKIGDYTGIVLAGPVLALVLSLIQGAIIGYIANGVLKMKIPTMQIGMIFIAGSASLILMAFSTVMAGTFEYGAFMTDIIGTGFIAPLFILGALPILHPFNACLGPDENQKRTLTLAVESGFIVTVIFGILSIALVGLAPAAITIVLGLIAWVFGYLSYWNRVKECGVVIKDTGLLPARED